MPRKRTFVIVGTVAALTAAIVLAVYLGGRLGGGCSSREEVTERVAAASSDLQQSAAEGKLTIDRLAEGIKRLNAAATAYETTRDHQAYCDAVEAMRDEFLPRD